MMALTLHQPWAALIAQGTKTIETRSWHTNYRGRLAIHAGKTKVSADECGMEPWRPLMATEQRGVLREKLSLGAVVAVARLVDVLPIVGPDSPCTYPRMLWNDTTSRYLTIASLNDAGGWDSLDVTDQLPFGDFTPGRYGWLLEDIEPLSPPVPARGRQRLWRWEPDSL